MNDQQVQIADDLAGLLEGELRCDPLSISMYASDGSLYQVPPLGVAFPRHRDDVITIARYCSEMRIPVIARGAGTGLAGESLGRGLVLDFSRHLRRVESIDDETIRVQPGLVYDRLNHLLRPFERYFPPDPSNASVTTIGSMLALDAAGSHSVRVGSTRDHVLSLETVLADGSCFEAGNEPLATEQYPQDDDPPSIQVKRTIVGKLAHLLKTYDPLIEQHQPPLPRNRCGYYLRGILSPSHVNLARLLVGSEGTLGLFTAATLHTAPLPAHRGVVLLCFGALETASRAVQMITSLQPSACDLLDRRLLSLARESDSRFESLIPPAAEAALLVEMVGFSEQQVRDRLQMVTVGLRSAGMQVVAHEAHTFEDVEFFWSLPRKVVSLLTRLQGPTRPLPFIEDIAVPPAALHEFLILAQNVFKKLQVTASLYSHAAAGQLHFRPFLIPPTPETAERLEQIAHDLYEAVFSVGGTISGEHGTGLSRSGFVRQQYGPLYSAFVQIKHLFDPQNLLNPGKVLVDDPHLIVHDLRPPAPTGAPAAPLNLLWQPEEAAQSAARCNGCGACRTQSAETRMCPLFRIDPLEDASPRAKANLMRDFTTGHLLPDDFASPAMKRIANLCFNCKQCQLDCPAHVNIPHMMIEAKAAYVKAHGLSGTDWILARAHSFGYLGSLFPTAANWALESPTARWVIERLLGVARQRKLPQFARRTFMQYAKRQMLTRPVRREAGQPSAVFFVDHYVNYHDPQLGRALVEVLRHHGIPVHVPPGQVTSGMALFSAGDLDPARDHADRNIRALADYAREGIPIICTEPAAALCLSQEYPRLIDHPDAQAVAEQVVEAGTFLRRLRDAGKLRTDFRPLDLDAGYHRPCHLDALGPGTPFADLLGLIPQLRLHRIEKGCSGMAGAWGLARDNYRASMRLGRGLMSRMRAQDLQIGTTECSSCKMQMEQATATPTLHPLKLLALSYGLLPEIASRLKSSKNKLVVT